MKIPNIMTPGPTQVRENVRLEMAKETTNPDIDLNFYETYKETTSYLQSILHTKNEVRILCGEGILGLEAACASLTEKGDRVLVIDNGVFGEGFKDFINIYEGEVVCFKGNRKSGIDINELEKFLNKDSNFKYATLVHCDTPSGVLNPIEKICPLLKKKNIVTVVDSVAAMVGHEVKVDDWGIDILLGGSQKCISAPVGLTIVSISKDAFDIMKKRKTPIKSFYTNLLIWEDYYKNKWFPYTQPIANINALKVALENIMEDNEIVNRHDIIANATRKAIIESGLQLYLDDSFSNTVTVIKVPNNIDDSKLIDYMVEKYNVLIAGSFDYLKGKVIRIGHMGENCRIHKLIYTLYALEKSLEHFGFVCKSNMCNTFLENIK